MSCRPTFFSAATLLLSIAGTSTTHAHDGHDSHDGHSHAHSTGVRIWTDAKSKTTFRGSFLASTGDKVTIENEKGEFIHVALANLNASDRAFAEQEIAEVDALNGKPLMMSMVACSPPPGSGALMVQSFTPFKPDIRFYWDATKFYVESDSMPNPTQMPNIMTGITSWQQQIPVPTAYFAAITNPETNTASLGYGKPNVWSLPLFPIPAAAPISLSGGNFQRGAIALAANGIPIFNPRNNTGQFSYSIGELDIYGGHCGRADDYHYHIAPVHLQGILGVSKPIAWALDGYPIYGYTEPDGTVRLPLDVDGGHSHGTWGYHYHAVGSAATGPQNPFMMNAFHGTVVNFGGQVDPQPSALSFAPAGSPLAGASIVASTRPTRDSYSMTYTLGGVSYVVRYQINRTTRTIAQHWEGTAGSTNPSYVNNSRFFPYQLAVKSMNKVPDTGQTISATTTFGEDSDYTINGPSFTDNGNGTITDNITGLMWQKTDSGEMTWDNAVATALTLNLGGSVDWRLPTPMEAFSILNHDRNPALDPTYFINNPSGTPQYFWTNDFYANDTTRVWATNAGGGIGPHSKSQTISAGGTSRFHARFVRGAKATLSHNYYNNLDTTISDIDAGLMWTQAPSSSMNWNAALNYAEGLTTAGYTDWRIPTVKELQSLVDISLATATTTATAKTALNRTLFPTATATAYWSSTALRGGTLTSAWLVEFGVNTAVPAANGPTRNFQGLVSYELQTSLYPLLAVRSTTGGLCECVADLNLDGVVDGNDLATLSGSWGPAAIGTVADFDGNRLVDAYDLAVILSGWGLCQ